MTTIPPSLEAPRPDAPRPRSRQWGDVVRVIAGILGGAIVASAITAAVVRMPAAPVSVADGQPGTTVART